ncbi:MAG TPA: tryptophan synthase subunit alpha [Cyclobacteriaceae bacterium]|nr:tryptophan synthase subunit alpha [Cyclobacteriaceae bacterium]
MTTFTVKNRITDLFESKKGNILSVFYTAGFPKLNDTVKIAECLENAGADIIEIGIPFSDPVADGPTIQESNKIALDNGMNLHLLLDQVKEIRKKVKMPIILMGYLNPVMQYGIENFCKDASAAGVDGLILPDMPMEEYQRDFKDLFERYGLSNTFLVSPTTSDQRIRRIDSVTSGFIYAVSASSTTGAKVGFSQFQLDYFQKLKSMNLSNPFLIGFGISNPDTFSTASSYGYGAIVGSAFINLIRNSNDLEGDITGFVKSLKGKN